MLMAKAFEKYIAVATDGIQREKDSPACIIFCFYQPGGEIRARDWRRGLNCELIPA